MLLSSLHDHLVRLSLEAFISVTQLVAEIVGQAASNADHIQVMEVQPQHARRSPPLAEIDTEAGKVLVASPSRPLVDGSDVASITMCERVAKPDGEAIDRHSDKVGIDVALVSEDISVIENRRL
jgi:hypothetical protein